jgi:glutathionylspermidine synthase
MVANLLTLHDSSDGKGLTRGYREWRRAYYDRFPAFWGTLPGASPEEYAIYGALEVPQEHVQALRTASSRLYRLMTRLVTVLQQADDQALLAIGLPALALPYVRVIIPQMPAVMCGRFEFALTEEGPKLLEFNAETPTFVVELFHVNGQVCADFGLADPNPCCQEQLAQAIHSSINAALSWLDLPQGVLPSIVFSSYADRKEERGTTEFYHRLLCAGESLPYRTSYCGLDELRVTPDGLFTASGERVDVLYKLYPTEYLIEDKAPDGTPVGLALMDLVCRRRLAIINPPAAFLLQNKALVAVLWAMHLAQSELFTAEEHLWIEQYLLPTYLDAHAAHEQTLFAGAYVIKPVYGREGASITIRRGHEVVEQSQERLYENQVMVYQHYVPLPTTTVPTEDGPQQVHLVHNCFIAAGVPSAIGVRASRKLIFDDNAYFLPVTVSGSV